MAPPAENDPRLTRFRRDARRGEQERVVAPGPPPVVPEFRRLEAAPSDPAPSSFAPQAAEAPQWAPPPASREAVSSEQLFAEFSPDKTAEPLYDTPAYDWMPVEADPGPTDRNRSIAVGVFFGVVGIFLGVHSIRRSRAVGLTGAIGIAGVIVSSLSILLFGSIILSWVRYEVELAQQCSLVGPGQYYTGSGDLVTCT